jgi:predicted phage tail protein
MTSYNGIGLTVDEVDIEYFIKASKFYDQTLSNGQKRFTLNYIVSEKKSRLETVTDMLVCCRSYLGYQNGKYLIIPETHEDTVQVFNPSEINDVEIWWSPMEEIADIIHVKYVDPEYEWVEVVAPARAKEPLRISQPYKIEMDVHGSTNFNQSSRLAWFYLNQSVTEKMYIKFKTDRRALNRTVGDIIEVDGDYILGYTTKKYRIIKFSDAPEGQIEVVCREHNPAIYVECSILDSNGNPAKYSVDANGNFLKDGNGNYIVDNVNGQFLPIDPLGSAEPIVNTTKLPNILNDIPTVTNIAMQESYLIQKNRHLVTNIVGTCTIPSYPFTNRVVVEYNKSGESAWVSGGLVDEGGNFIIRNVETPYYGQTPITYNIRIYVENRLLKKSDYATATIDITGKYTPPTSITTLTATQSAQDKCTINLTWTAISDLDLASYEIREGRTFETSNVIYSPTLNETSYSYKTTESRVYNFYIRALDTSGNYSEVPATCSITLDTHPSSPATITASQLLELNRKYIRINWDSVSDVDINYYQIRVLKDNDLGTWDTATVISDQIKSTTLDYMISENGSYKFLVKAVNNGGVSSVNATVSTAYAFQVIPSTFTLTSIAQASSDRTLVEIKWGECIDSDLLKYEVCLGSTWDDANIIQTTKETSYSYKVSASGITSFLIRAMNTSNFTTTPILAQINVNLTVPTPTCSITGVTSDANNRLIQHLKWDVSPLTDFDHFEICYKTWDDANKVTTKDNFLDWILNQNDSNIVFLVKVVTVAGLSSLALSISAIFHIEPTDVINLSVTRTSVKKSMFDVSWTKVFDTDIAYYEIRVGGESDTWDTATTTYTKVYDYPYQISITTEQVSKVMIKAVSVAGYYSKNACSTTVDTTPTGYSLHPSTPTNVSVIWNTLNRDKVVISWDKINDLDFENYGLRPLGVTWDDASVITTTNNTVTITIPSTGTYTYVLRSKNDIGFYSNEVTVDVGAITLEPSTIDSNSITLTQENDTDKRVVTIKWTGISDIDLKNYIVNIEKV